MNSLESEALEIVDALQTAGFDAWWVGGCVRDRLLGMELTDIDIATNARPEQILNVFENVRLVGAAFGVCLVRLGDRFYEVATYRKDGRYIDHRHPESVDYGTLEEDALRRDFTVNAMYLNPRTGELRDPADGSKDLDERIIRTVGEPERRFDEDALRLLRAIRFAARLEFQIAPQTWQGILRHARRIRSISPERTRDELTRMLVDPNAPRALRLLDESGLLEILLPEIAAMKGVEQGVRYHPEGDVFEHTLLCLEKLEERTPTTCWAALLHDVGKPPAFKRRSGKITFYEHDAIGAEMADAICRRFRFSNESTRRITAIVARHMRFMHAHEWKNSTMRRFLDSETIKEDLAVHRADCLASHGKLRNWQLVSEALRAASEHEGPSLPPPILNGEDLKRLGFQPGPIFSEILDAVQERQLDGLLGNKEEAENFVFSTYGNPGKPR